MTGAALAISASGASVLCALRIGAGPAVGPGDAPAARGTDLVPIVEALCAAHGVDPAALSTLRVDVGPGSYTGLRVAVTFARVTAAFTGAQLEQLTSLELLARAAWARGGADPSRELAVVLDARRGRFHAARLALRDGTIRFATDAAAVTAEELQRICAHGRPQVLAAAALRDQLGDAALRALEPVPVTVEDLFAPELLARRVDVDAIEPLYLMATYAD